MGKLCTRKYIRRKEEEDEKERENNKREITHRRGKTIEGK